jgi:hypothetical protein
VGDKIVELGGRLEIVEKDAEESSGQERSP